MIARSGETFRKLSRAFGRVPSLAYATVYLLLIPSFGALFAFQSRAFHSPLAHLEPRTQKQLTHISELLVRDLSSPETKADRAEAVPDSIRISDVYVRLVACLGDSVVGGLTLVSSTPSHPNEVWSASIAIQPGWEQTLLSKRARVKSPPRRPVVWLSLNWFRPPGRPDDPSHLLLIHRALTGAPQMVGMGPWTIPASDDLDQALLAYRDAVRGLPSSFWETLPRMVYLSAITITTVGYGDIVPLTDLARGCVAVQALLGVVLVGLFLNSLAREAYRA